MPPNCEFRCKSSIIQKCWGFSFIFRIFHFIIWLNRSWKIAVECYLESDCQIRFNYFDAKQPPSERTSVHSAAFMVIFQKHHLRTLYAVILRMLQSLAYTGNYELGEWSGCCFIIGSCFVINVINALKGGFKWFTVSCDRIPWKTLWKSLQFT